uniref:Uncharacterized protein n=1 Tax=Helianthus annuus TaxID=4232 RepID=A0A251RM90_HELAN
MRFNASTSRNLPIFNLGLTNRKPITNSLYLLQYLEPLTGPVRISVVESLSESVGSLKEKIAGEIQLPCKQTETEWEDGFFKRQYIACLLQRWRR